MAIFRKIHTSFWSDSFIQDLDKEQKLFYIYLLTNERTKQCGVYEITKKQIAYDLGYSIDKVSVLIKYFINKGRIKYNEDTKELAIGNWLKYNLSTSPKVQSCINKEFTQVKDTVLIEYVKSMDTSSQEEEEQEEEQKQEEVLEKDIYSMDYILNLFIKKQETIWTDSYIRKEAEKFYNFYSAKDWMIGKNKIKSMPHAVAGWINRANEYGKAEVKVQPMNATGKTPEQMTQQERDYYGF